MKIIQFAFFLNQTKKKPNQKCKFCLKALVLYYYITKGQLILKYPFGVFKSPPKFRISALASKKRSNQKDNNWFELFLEAKAEIFKKFRDFWEIWRHPKYILKLTDL